MNEKMLKWKWDQFIKKDPWMILQNVTFKVEDGYAEETFSGFFPVSRENDFLKAKNFEGLFVCFFFVNNSFSLFDQFWSF